MKVVILALGKKSHLYMMCNNPDYLFTELLNLYVAAYADLRFLQYPESKDDSLCITFILYSTKKKKRRRLVLSNIRSLST